MPKTVALINDELGIRIDDEAEYVLGDTITGHVATSQIVIRGQDGPKTHHGRWNLVHPVDHTQQLFEGRLEVSDAEEKAWPFSITLPTHVDLKCVEDLDGFPSFLPLDEEHPLPSTFELGKTIDQKMDGLVEYWLQAGLKNSKEGGISTLEAKLPFTIANPNAEKSDGFEMMSSNRTATTKSFISDSIPRYTFDCEPEVPMDIELDDPEPMSFTLRFTPDLDHTSERLCGKPQKIKLSNISLRIITTTEILCGVPGSHVMDEKVEVKDLRIWETIKDRQEDTNFTLTEGSHDLDVGELIGLCVGRYGRIVPDPPKDEQPLIPGFRTFNIRCKNDIAWSVEGQVADKSFDIGGGQTLNLWPKGGRPVDAVEDSDGLAETE
ncbi:hypothetical protein ACJZ2D_004408 [Fusarium nematophilum]